MFELGIRAIHQKDIRSAILEAKKNDFKVLEIHFSAPQFFPEKFSSKELAEIKKFAKENNIVLQAHSPIDFSLVSSDKFIRQAEKNRLKTMIKFCKQTGARCITLHPGKPPIYHTSEDKKIFNEDKYPKMYSSLFEDSIKYIISIVPKDLFVCIENTDYFFEGYRNVLKKYFKTNKIFLTWDIMKNFSGDKLKEDHWEFLKNNLKYIKNLHISGPGHKSLVGMEERFRMFFELFKNKNLPMIIECIPLKYAIESREVIRKLGY